MKPLILLGETKLIDGRALELSRRDDTFFLRIEGTPALSSAEDHALTEATELVCAPLRPARQPKIFLAPLDLGAMSDAICTNLGQNKALFLVNDSTGKLSSWIREQPDLKKRAKLDDERLSINTQSFSAAMSSEKEWSGMLINLDLLDRIDPEEAKALKETSGLQRLYDSMVMGGLLVIIASDLNVRFEKTASRAGFDCTRERIPMSLKARRARLQTVWLLKKGSYVSRGRR